ncbi:hypothetical protein [Pyxidicoccus xibeiensis]|uniref:hypothetical protein n=1 Tax=Pyxidicoccus xibeiensis TaxID=2906759 RepID=UPI0020A75D20|nr:hypothetical protein [Pyxidicoccus xibeiensis]MCP3139100.1 hypothetical protein [Pyxidicoccus xibeiensis]
MKLHAARSEGLAVHAELERLENAGVVLVFLLVFVSVVVGARVARFLSVLCGFGVGLVASPGAVPRVLVAVVVLSTVAASLSIIVPVAVVIAVTVVIAVLTPVCGAGRGRRLGRGGRRADDVTRSGWGGAVRRRSGGLRGFSGGGGGTRRGAGIRSGLRTGGEGDEAEEEREAVHVRRGEHVPFQSMV